MISSTRPSRPVYRVAADIVYFVFDDEGPRTCTTVYLLVSASGAGTKLNRDIGQEEFKMPALQQYAQALTLPPCHHFSMHTEANRSTQHPCYILHWPTEDYKI